ncbi:MAG: DUF4260 domain-containing protein [Gemmatimonadota bacterium]
MTNPIVWLRLEGLVVLVVSVAAYAAMDGGWLLFAVLLLAPDASMLGYLRDPWLGAVSYNVGHTYLAPAALAAAGWVTGSSFPLQLALIWTAHIGLDRMLGFGLKRATGFGDTHLGPTRKG